MGKLFHCSIDQGTCNEKPDQETCTKNGYRNRFGSSFFPGNVYSSNGKVLKFQNISQNVTFLIWGGITLLSLEKKALFSHSQNVCCRDLNGLKSLEMTWGGQVLLNFRSSYLQKWL